MPSDIEIGFYEMGVRMAQCHILHSFAMADGYDDNRRNEVETSVACLDAAFATLKRLVQSSSIQFPTGSMQIERCRQLCREFTTAESSASPGGKELRRFVDCLRKLHRCINAIAEGISSDSPNSLDWYLAGSTICSIDIDLPSESPGDDLLEFKRTATLARAGLNGLLPVLGVSLAELLPDQPPNKDGPLLPYPDERFENWIQIEAGLEQLRTKSQPAVHNLEIRLEPPSAILDGTPYSLANRDSAIYLKALLDANGNRITVAEIAAKCPEFKGARPHRILKKLPEPIAILVEVVPGRGSQIRLSRR
jgi:hypothetical protein